MSGFWEKPDICALDRVTLLNLEFPHGDCLPAQTLTGFAIIKADENLVAACGHIILFVHKCVVTEGLACRPLASTLSVHAGQVIPLSQPEF